MHCKTLKRKTLKQFARVLALLVLVCAWGVCAHPADAMAEARCDYYAAPDGRGNGQSPSTPFVVSKFWSVAAPGKTLCLLDGTYTGSEAMIVPPAGMNGTATLPITIRALNDGQVLIHGQNARMPVKLYQNDYFVLEGFNACCSNANVVDIGGPGGTNNGSDSTIVRRVVAWQCPIKENCKIFQITGSRGVLMEDVAGFGTARKIFEIYRSDSSTIRRAWGRWEGSTRNPGPKITFACQYRAYGSTCENVVGTWSGESQPDGVVPTERQGVISHDRLEANDDPWQPTPRNFQARMKVLGSIAYLEEGAKYAPPQGVKVTKINDVELQNTVSYVAAGGAGQTVNPFVLGPAANPSGQQLQASNLVGVGGKTSAISTDWKVSRYHTTTTSASSSVYTNAQLCYRYVDGVLTSVPLWPWPMNQRIIDAMKAAGKAPVDVTATVTRLLGPVPAQCKQPDTPQNFRIVQQPR